VANDDRPIDEDLKPIPKPIKPTVEKLRQERQIYKLQKKFSSLTNKQQDTFLSILPVEDKEVVTKILRGLKKKGNILGLGAALVGAGMAAKKAYEESEDNGG
jgi:hypothetical protein